MQHHCSGRAAWRAEILDLSSAPAGWRWSRGADDQARCARRRFETAAEGRQAVWEAMLMVAVCGDVLVDMVGTDVEQAMLRYRRDRAEAASFEPEDERP